MQTGKYEELLEEIKVKYKEGFYLSRTDFMTIIHRFTEFKRYDLTKQLYTILKEYESPYIVENAPLFCYNFLLLGDIQSAFSLLTSSSDQFLALRKEQAQSSRFQAPLLPQEYLFVRLCIQLMSDAVGLDTDIAPFSQSLPRRNKEISQKEFVQRDSRGSYSELSQDSHRNHSSIPSQTSRENLQSNTPHNTKGPHLENPINFTSQSQSIVNCYLYSWNYLTTAIKQKRDSHQEPKEDYSSRKLRELFASPYSPISGSSRSFTDSSFSSFTLRFGEQRLASTLRSLELLLWFYYSRSVFDMNVVRQRPQEMGSFSETIENVFESMKNQYEFWNTGIFQFFIFYYAQPVKTLNSIHMRNEAIVDLLLKEMKSRDFPLSPSFAEMLSLKQDLKTETLQLLFSFYIHHTRTPTQLNSFTQEHGNLITVIASALVKRDAKKEFQQLVNDLFYLNIYLPEKIMNQLVLLACLSGQTDLKTKLVQRTQLTPETICSCIIEGVVHSDSISAYLAMIDDDKKWEWLLLHIRLNVQSMQLKNSPEGRKLTEFLESRHVHYTNESTYKLYTYYLNNCDYKNIVNLYYTIKKEHISIESSRFKEIESTVNTIIKSKSRLFGTSTILERMQVRSEEKWLPRPNSKFSVDKTSPLLRRALAVFKDDESTVSINALIESTVKSYCETSILHYGTWIFCVY